MSTRIQRISTGLARVIGASLPCLIFAVPAQATQSVTVESTIPIEELVELEEVRVRGKLVANAVITAENRVFMRYNELNKDNRYDVHCRDVRARDSLALLRICVPEFLSMSIAPALVPTSFSGRSFGTYYSQCGGMSAMTDGSGNAFHSSSCSTGGIASMGGPFFSGNYYGGSASNPSAGAVRVVASPERIAEFKQTMTRVISSDPQLQGMAAELIGMYEEVERVQDRYGQLQEERRAAQRAKRAEARARGRDLWPPHPRAP